MPSKRKPIKPRKGKSSRRKSLKGESSRRKPRNNTRKTNRVSNKNLGGSSNKYPLSDNSITILRTMVSANSSDKIAFVKRLLSLYKHETNADKFEEIEGELKKNMSSVKHTPSKVLSKSNFGDNEVRELVREIAKILESKLVFNTKGGGETPGRGDTPGQDDFKRWRDEVANINYNFGQNNGLEVYNQGVEYRERTTCEIAIYLIMFLAKLGGGAILMYSVVFILSGSDKELADQNMNIIGDILHFLNNLIDIMDAIAQN